MSGSFLATTLPPFPPQYESFLQFPTYIHNSSSYLRSLSVSLPICLAVSHFLSLIRSVSLSLSFYVTLSFCHSLTHSLFRSFFFFCRLCVLLAAVPSNWTKLQRDASTFYWTSSRLRYALYTTP